MRSVKCKRSAGLLVDPGGILELVPYSGGGTPPAGSVVSAEIIADLEE